MDWTDFTVDDTFTIPMDSTSSTSLNFTGVTIIDDDIIEGDELFTLRLPNQADVDFTIGDVVNVAVTIENDDCKWFNP